MEENLELFKAQEQIIDENKSDYEIRTESEQIDEDE